MITGNAFSLLTCKRICISSTPGKNSEIFAYEMDRVPIPCTTVAFVSFISTRYVDILW